MRKTSKRAAPVQTGAASKTSNGKCITAPAHKAKAGCVVGQILQLLIFPVSGVWSEPYLPARTRRRAKAAKGGERRMS